MKTHILTIAFVLCGACLFAVTRTPAPADQQVVAAEIDLIALRAQADGALGKLQQLREQRLALGGGAAF